MKRKASSLLIGFIIFFTFILGLNSFISLSFSQIEADSITIYSDFNLIEFGEDKGEMINVSSIEFSFPSDSWNITEIELNFTDIRYNREIFEVEDEIVDHSRGLGKNYPKAYAVQMNITEPTEIYAVYLFGDETIAATSNVYVQIVGYDNASDQPNTTIYGSMLINMTNQTRWHVQQFSTPILLQKADYYLVINGTEMPPPDPGKYYWGFNDINPNNPSFYTWEDLGSGWVNNATGEPFLYKLDQKIIGEFYPSDINLTAKIDENSYPISDGFAFGMGKLNINSSIFLQENDFNISIVSNGSFSLIFNVSYHLHLQHYITTQGSGYVEEDLENEWILNPNIQRAFYDYSIQFNYPASWQNLTVFRRIGLGWNNVNSEITIDELNKIIYLPNSTILYGAEWRFTAASPNIEFLLNFPITEWVPGQELQFSAHAPVTSGNLTFVITDPIGLVEYSEVKIISVEDTPFTFLIPSNSIDGTYIAKIYWNNETDAGVQTQEFLVTSPPVPPVPVNVPILVAIISLIIIGISGVSGISFLAIRNYRRKFLEKKQNTYKQCVDILNLDYIMVTDKNSGLNVYTQNFSAKKVDATLISGFLQAISSFGIEMMKVEDRSQTIKLEYKDSIILMSEFVNLRLILLMQESPSKNFLFSLEDLAYDVYKNYGDRIDSFNGDVKPFTGIKDLLKQHLNISFISPLKIAKIEKLAKIRINQSQRILINNAVNRMKTENKNHFFIRDIMSGKECNPKDIENILDLMDKKIFYLY